jgi:hypothetical protein
MLKKKQDFKDIPFFISKNPFTNDLNTVNNLPAIRQALKNIILTNNGERSFDYEFGGNLYDTLFENIEDDAKIEIQLKLLEQIQVYEPRVKVDEIYVIPYPSENRIDITVQFSIPTVGIFDTINLSVLRTR